MTTMNRSTTPSLDDLFAEWQRLEHATGRTDEQLDADNYRVPEIERQMAAIPAANAQHVANKLTAYGVGAFGCAADNHPLIASCIADLERLARIERWALGDLTPAQIVDLADRAEALQAHLDTYARAASALGSSLGTIDGAHDEASVAYAVSNVLEALHREATDLTNLFYHAKEAARAGDVS